MEETADSNAKSEAETQSRTGPVVNPGPCVWDDSGSPFFAACEAGGILVLFGMGEEVAEKAEMLFRASILQASALMTEKSTPKTQSYTGPVVNPGPYDGTDGRGRFGRFTKLSLAFRGGGSSFSVSLNAQRKRYEPHPVKPRTGRAHFARRRNSSRCSGDNPARVSSLDR